jgi:hypothetical protein
VIEGKPTMAVLTQALNDHLRGCEAQGERTNRRLGRIESVMIAVAGTAILQLLVIVGYLLTHTAGVAH